jgi:aspartyl-tRNA(Asn)/glutamyl-tRNA(Gln) amidotransferase subunit C
MSVTTGDVRHIAMLARLGLDQSRLDSLTRELSSILNHMEELRAADTSTVSADDAVGRGAAPLRADDCNPIPLALQRADFAPSYRDGFFVVPRLATHEEAEE